VTEASRAVDREPKPVVTVGFGLAIFLGALGTDGFLPAMMALAVVFQTDVAHIQFALAAFFLGGTIGQAIIGPLADRFGRRPTLLIGVALYSLSALLAVWATDVVMLIVLRFFQGTGGASGRIVVRAIIRDLYSREMGAKILSYTTVIGICIPIFGPIISAQLLVHFGWEAVFVFMAGFSAALFVLLWIYVEESLSTKNVHAIKPMVMVMNFIDIAKNRTFLIYASLFVGPSVGLSAFLAGSAAVLIGARGLDPGTYSYAFAVVMVANSISSFANAHLVMRFGFAPMLLAGTTICALGGLAELALALAGVESVWAIIGPMAVFMIGWSFVSAPAQAGALVPFPDRAGAASSLIGIMQGLLTTCVTTLVGLLPGESAVPMAACTALAGLAILAIYLSAARRLNEDES
jgi:DHA1 family bicyclomycin/chloramphenicol resistance-like MFS transporter